MAADRLAAAIVVRRRGPARCEGPPVPRGAQAPPTRVAESGARATQTLPSSGFSHLVVVQHRRFLAEQSQIRVKLAAMMPVLVVGEQEKLPGRVRSEERRV